MNILNEFGAYVPILIIAISVFYLKDFDNLLFYYFIGLFFNSILNIILKGIIQQPRPILDIKKTFLAVTHAKRYFYQNGVPFDIFGMPSGHAQASMFSTIFVYLATKKPTVLLIMLALTFITCWQRVDSMYHSISQVLVGLLVGALVAYFVFRLVENKIKGKIREKPDDNCWAI